jgi:hypothetical protein
MEGENIATLIFFECGVVIGVRQNRKLKNL